MNEEEMATTDPVELFHQWMGEAEKTEPNDHNAVALATATKDGTPSVRMVLLKRVTDGSFCFFTNEQSEKGEQLTTNPHAAMCFHWKSLRRQVRLEGNVTTMPDPEVDQYFYSRSRGSQLGAAVSAQSRVLPNRELLEQQVRSFGAEHPDVVPRPAFWRGYCLNPQRIEFWKDGKDRLHDRFLYTRAESGWHAVRLYP